MRLARPRLTTRRLMLVVVLAGVILGSYVAIDTMIRRSRLYWNTGVRCLANVQSCHQLIRVHEASRGSWQISFQHSLAETGPDGFGAKEALQQIRIEEDQIALYQRRSDRWSSLQLKYFRGACRPWRVLPPDPPEE